MRAWAKEPNQEIMKRVPPRVFQAESLSSPRAIEINDRATTTSQTVTMRQTFGDLARIPAHSHPIRENNPIPMMMGAIHKEFTSFHVNGFWSTRT